MTNYATIIQPGFLHITLRYVKILHVPMILAVTVLTQQTA